jgi:hypothetical protein
LIVSRDSATSAGSVGSGSIQVTSGRVFRFRGDRFLRGAEVHRPGAALAPLEQVEADVGRDPVEPRAKRRAALESVEVLPGAQERLLDGVLGLEGRPEHPVAVRGQLATVLLELAEGRRGGGGRALHPPHRRGSRTLAAESTMLKRIASPEAAPRPFVRPGGLPED